VTDRKRTKDAKDIAQGLVAEGGDPSTWRTPLAGTVRKLLVELERRIADGEMSTLEVIGALKTLCSIDVEAAALLGREDPPG
jgi:biotin carboxyl carrier protein